MAEAITHRRTLQLSVLDISAQPHPDGSYIELFRNARKLRRAIKILGQDFGEISPLSYEKNEEGQITEISGQLYRFTKIDEKGDWFDTSTGETAEGDALDGLSIPSNLRPNTRIIHWVFIVKNHLLVFAKKNGEATLSAAQAAKYFSTLMDLAARPIEGVDTIDVTIVKSKESIDRIFTKPTVSSLEIDIRRPNNDGPSRALKKIEKTMEEEGAARWEEKLKSTKGGTLKKSNRIEELLYASQRLGSAKAITYDSGGEREEIDTKNHPLEETVEYDPAAKVPLIPFLIAAAIALVLEISRGRK